ncbi:putative assembly chaperone of rpl4 [Golovinomyces cichoracearum]|uniref:Putative assembly chaperone of rpl4 n=1 Tax=Golovinomyces cichoracearum TaxID=62708 RepID=A0A420IQY8_9PEZI|nr:putative assembly chaperone of rpl4 [Golovinomyces cichoracearum]
MAKTKPKDKNELKKKSWDGYIPSKTLKTPSSLSPKILLEQAAQSLQLGDADSAILLAQQAHDILGAGTKESLPALNLCGEINIELGNIELARKYFLQAANIDSDGTIDEDHGGGPEKFLWLAQLSENGGYESVECFEKGCTILRRQIRYLNERQSSMTIDSNKTERQNTATLIDEKIQKLAGALCSIVEVFMTDLSWEEDAEQKCETLITEATMIAPNFAEPWQTLANVRISQQRLDDAQAALKRSINVWKDLPCQDPHVPDYPTRVSLARLLMEAELDTEAIEILEGLVAEDDSSVEVWYLGGWGLYILGEKQRNNIKNCNSDKISADSEKNNVEKDRKPEDWRNTHISSRQWLEHALNLFKQQNYEDERLGEHARELLETLKTELGEEGANSDQGEEDDSDGDWSSFKESEEDEAMVDAE